MFTPILQLVSTNNTLSTRFSGKIFLKTWTTLDLGFMLHRSPYIFYNLNNLSTFVPLLAGLSDWYKWKFFKSVFVSIIPKKSYILGADFKNNQTTKILNNFYLDKQEGRNKTLLASYWSGRIVYLFCCLIVFKIRSQVFLDDKKIQMFHTMRPIVNKKKKSQEFSDLLS